MINVITSVPYDHDFIYHISGGYFLGSYFFLIKLNESTYAIQMKNWKDESMWYTVFNKIKYYAKYLSA